MGDLFEVVRNYGFINAFLLVIILGIVTGIIGHIIARINEKGMGKSYETALQTISILVFGIVLYLVTQFFIGKFIIGSGFFAFQFSFIMLAFLFSGIVAMLTLLKDERKEEEFCFLQKGPGSKAGLIFICVFIWMFLSGLYLMLNQKAFHYALTGVRLEDISNIFMDLKWWFWMSISPLFLVSMFTSNMLIRDFKSLLFRLKLLLAKLKLLK